MGVQIGLAPWERAWQTLKPSICAPWSIFTLLGGTPRDTAMSYKSIHRGIAHKQHENPKFCQGWGGRSSYSYTGDMYLVGSQGSQTQEQTLYEFQGNASHTTAPEDRRWYPPITLSHQETGGGPLGAVSGVVIAEGTGKPFWGPETSASISSYTRQ